MVKQITTTGVLLLLSIILAGILKAANYENNNIEPQTIDQPEDRLQWFGTIRDSIQNNTLELRTPTIIGTDGTQYRTFQPLGYNESVTIPDNTVVIPLKQYQALLNSAHQNGFDINSLTPIGAWGNYRMASLGQIADPYMPSGSVIRSNIEINGTLYNPTELNSAIILGQ